MKSPKPSLYTQTTDDDPQNFKDHLLSKYWLSFYRPGVLGTGSDQDGPFPCAHGAETPVGEKLNE